MSRFSMLRFTVAIGVACMLGATSAQADWVVFGAGAQCVEGQSFSLRATTQVSPEDPQAGVVHLPKGYVPLVLGRKGNSFSCRVGAGKVKALVEAYDQNGGPSQCQGSGYVQIDRLTVNGFPVFQGPIAFNRECGSMHTMPIQVTISGDKGTPVIEVCQATDWRYDTGYQGVQCSRISLAPDGELNRAYKAAMARLKAAGRVKLRQSQRAWLHTRDQACRTDDVTAQGRDDPLAYLTCVMEETKARTAKLRHWRP